MGEESRDHSVVLVTGAGGFVGTALVDRLRIEPELRPRAASRRALPGIDGIETVTIPDLTAAADWSAALAGVDTVIHLAARVHVMRDSAADPLAAFRTVNTTATENLARQAARTGVRRFVYLSSIKVNGEQSVPGRPFTERDEPAPADPYGVSKHEAEVALRRVAQETGLEVVTIRPPLVYGPGVRANFRSMMNWLRRGIPLPLGALHNRRSLVGLDNLVDLIIKAVRHPSAVNQTFLAGDGEDLSTSQLLKRLGDALGRPARLVPVPPGLLQIGFAMVGKQDMGQRLCGSLQVDISKARHLLGWNPPLSVDESLRRVAMDFLGQRTT
jgi:nucleoside-diphosphate-sugar epimerase